MGNILLPKEIEYEEIQTPHGIFTSNTHLGLTAQEVYEKWLYDKENPKPIELTLEEVVKENEKKISILEEENKALKEELVNIQASITSLAATLEN